MCLCLYIRNTGLYHSTVIVFSQMFEMSSCCCSIGATQAKLDCYTMRVCITVDTALPLRKHRRLSMDQKMNIIKKVLHHRTGLNHSL